MVVAEDVAAKADATATVSVDRLHIHNAVLPIVSDDAVMRQLHHAALPAPQPKVAGSIFGQRLDGIVTQSVLQSVNMVTSALRVACGEKFKKSVRNPRPQPMIRGLEELINPLALGVIGRVERKCH